MIKKKTPTSLSMFTIILLMIVTIYSIIILSIIFCNKVDEKVNPIVVKALITTEPTELEKQEIVIKVPKALEDMPKPDPKPIYTEPYKYVPVDMMYETSAKTYMDYRSITDHSSSQYNFIHSDKIKICEDGFLRDSEGYIGVAMGYQFGEIGSRYICHLDTGKDIKVIKIEAKAKQDSIKGFCGANNYDIIEFVIDSRANWMRSNVWGNDMIFSGNFNNYEEMNGVITSIDKVESNS